MLSSPKSKARSRRAKSENGLKNPDGPQAGDIENIEVRADGTGNAEIVNKQRTLAEGPNCLFHEGGTAIVIHASPDDNVTDPTGNAGARIALRRDYEINGTKLPRPLLGPLPSSIGLHL